MPATSVLLLALQASSKPVKVEDCSSYKSQTYLPTPSQAVQRCFVFQALVLEMAECRKEHAGAKLNVAE